MSKERWKIIRQVFQPISDDGRYRVGVVWESKDLGDDLGTDLERGLRSHSGFDKRGAALHEDAQRRYAAIREAYNHRRDKYPNEPRGTSKQRVANDFHIDVKTVHRALKEK